MKTGSKDLDSLFEYKNEITMIYGEAATGKTTLATLAAIGQARQEKKIIFVDAENSFSVERFKQLAGKDYEEIINNIIFFRPRSLSEQRKTIKDIVQLVETGKIGLVIVDTIGMHYRAELRKDEKYANRTIAENIRTFKWIAEKNIPVIITNQVYSDMNNSLRNVGGNMILDACQTAIMLEKNPRKLVMIKPGKIEAKFEIMEDNIYLAK